MGVAACVEDENVTRWGWWSYIDTWLPNLKDGLNMKHAVSL